MANEKISQLPAASTSSNGDLYPLVQGGVNYSITFTNLKTALGITSNAISVLTGDVSATGPGTAVATVNYVGGQTASAIASAVIKVGNATSTDTPSTLITRDSYGNFSAGTITANLTGNASGSAASFTGSLSGDVTGTQGATTLTATSNSTLVTLSALSLLYSQLTGVPTLLNTVGTIDSEDTPSANGATIDGNELIMQSASATVPGLVNNTEQTFSGNKTFTGTALFSASGTALTVTNESMFGMVSINGAPESAALNVKANGNGNNSGINIISNDGSQTWSIFPENNGGLFFYNVQTISMTPTGMSIGSQRANATLNINSANSGTDVTTVQLVPSLTLWNFDPTNGNFSAINFGNSTFADESGGDDGITSSILGVNETQVVPGTGHMSFVTANAGTRTEVLRLTSAATIRFPTYTTPGILTNDSSGNVISTPDISVGSVSVGSISSSAPQTVLTGSSGTATFSEPFQGSSYKKIVIYLNNYTDTSTQTYTYPVAFVNTPYVYGLSAGVAGAATTTTGVTFTVTSATGFVFIEGY